MDHLVPSIYSLLSTLVLANSATASEEDKSCFLTSPLIPTNIQNFFCDQPVFVWLVAIFIIISMAVTAVAALTGNVTAHRNRAILLRMVEERRSLARERTEKLDFQLDFQG